MPLRGRVVWSRLLAGIGIGIGMLVLALVVAALVVLFSCYLVHSAKLLDDDKIP